MIFFVTNFANTKFLVDWLNGKNEILKHLEVTLTIKWRTLIKMIRHRDAIGKQICD
jgi:hypothetical protein